MHRWTDYGFMTLHCNYGRRDIKCAGRFKGPAVETRRRRVREPQRFSLTTSDKREKKRDTLTIPLLKCKRRRGVYSLSIVLYDESGAAQPQQRILNY